MKITKARLQEIIKEEIAAVDEAQGPEHALGKWVKMFPRAAKALEAMGAKIEDIKKAIDDSAPEPTDRLSAPKPDEFDLGVFEQEEPDMRTPAERYGRNEAEIGTLEILDSAISDAQADVDINVLRAFLEEALKNIL